MFASHKTVEADGVFQFKDGGLVVDGEAALLGVDVFYAGLEVKAHGEVGRIEITAPPGGVVRRSAVAVEVLVEQTAARLVAFPLELCLQPQTDAPLALVFQLETLVVHHLVHRLELE